jgi:hypothetical protein
MEEERRREGKERGGGGAGPRAEHTFWKIPMWEAGPPKPSHPRRTNWMKISLYPT